MNMETFNWREFKPTIFFLVKFLGLYIVSNLIYGAYVTAWSPRPDPVTHWVSVQTAWVIRVIGYEATPVDREDKPITLIMHEENPILSVYEGCNGINSTLVFLAFLLAFGPYKRALVWFTLLGIVLLHVTNLVRIVLLFFISIHWPNYLYITHKYLFTASIYLVAFALWVWWVRRVSKG
jgi:exosortase family protein XrtF